MRASRTGVLLSVLALAGCRGVIGGLAGGDDSAGLGGSSGSAGHGPGKAGGGQGSTNQGGSAQGGAGPTAGSGGGACVPNLVATSVRRLARSQYLASLREAFGESVTLDLAVLPVDEVVLGYASNRGLPTTSQGVQAYQTAAEKVAEQVAQKIAMVSTCDPKAKGDETCAKNLFEQIAPAFLRHRPTDVERARWLSAFQTGAKSGGYASGIRIATSRLLQSPSFLYALDTLDPAGTGQLPLTGPALATRLSLLLWNGPPDAALLAAAEQGKLLQEQGLRDEADRMLKDDTRAARFTRQFAWEWLGIAGIDQDIIDPTRLAPFQPVVLTEMKEDAGRFVDHVLRKQQGSLHDLLLAPFSFPQGSEAGIYGTGKPAAGGATEWPAGQRSGLLTLPAVLYRTAHSSQTSPVLRGKWVREAMFCTEPPPPPKDVMAVEPKITEGTTTRERYAEHRNNPKCSGCHELMDDIGFTFEHYDQLGRYRTKDGNQPVDSSGNLSGTDVDGKLTGVADLAQKLGQSAEVQSCMARQIFRYAEGRPETEGDTCVLQQMQAALAGPAPLRHALLTYVLSPTFRQRKMP